MANLKKKLLPFIPQFLWRLITKSNDQMSVESWINAGRPLPPPHSVKRMVIDEFKGKYSYNNFVETGTYLGDMVELQKNNFANVYSIELGKDLHAKATKRFKKDSNVEIIQGDSGKMLFELVPKLNGPAIFWLDGHYSAGITAKGDKDCPVFEELDAIFEVKPSEHVILIDDARCFVGKDDYPTIAELTAYLKKLDEAYVLEVEHDIIRCFRSKDTE